MVLLGGMSGFETCLFSRSGIICSWPGACLEDWALDLGAYLPAARERAAGSTSAVIGWNCTSPHGDDNTDICIFVPEAADGLSVLITGFPRLISFPGDCRSLSTLLKFPREKCRYPCGVGKRSCGEFEQQIMLCLQIEIYADSASKKRR